MTALFTQWSAYLLLAVRSHDSENVVASWKSIGWWVRIGVYTVTSFLLTDSWWQTALLVVVFVPSLVWYSRPGIAWPLHITNLFLGALLLYPGMVSASALQATIEGLVRPGLFLILLAHPAAAAIHWGMSKWELEPPNEAMSLEHAGRLIGILERMLVFAFVVQGHMEAVGFLLAAKSVFRFGDLNESRDRKLTEYVLIGTLLSFGCALLVGFAYTSFFQAPIDP